MADDPTRDRACREPSEQQLPQWLLAAIAGSFDQLDEMMESEGLAEADMARWPQFHEVPPPVAALALQQKLRKLSYSRKRPIRTGLHEGSLTRPPVASLKPTPWLPRRKLSTVSRELLLKIPRGQFVLPLGTTLDDISHLPGHLDLFSGSRGAARALANRTGRWVLCYDLKHSPREDLLDQKVQAEIGELILADVFLSLTAGPVCASFSRAVWPVVRTSQEPLGVKHMTDAMREKVRQGNSFASWLAQIARLALQRKMVLWIENPATSFLWWHPEIVLLKKDFDLDYFLTDYCRWGTSWRKRTRFSGNFSATGLKLFCNCSHEHVRLRGYSQYHRTSWTKVAEPYPRSLCRFLAIATAESLKPPSRRVSFDPAACAQCGHRRIGEAKNPGPRLCRNYPRELDLEDVALVQPATALLQTRVHERYCNWLVSRLSSPAVGSLEENPQLQVLFLRAFGNEQFRTGEPMYLFRHLVVYLQQMFPGERPRLASAWDLLARWELVQPVTHRPPLPKVLLDAMLSLAISWGWLRWASLTSLAFHGAMRVGEPLKATPGDLLLPADAGLDEEVCFLRVGAPKPGRRGRGKVQHARISDTFSVKLAAAVFGMLASDELLYPVAPATYRRRWDHLLATLGVPKSLAITPGCLRGGGACYLYHTATPISDILWRMRLRQVVTLEFYLQEAAAMNIMQQLPQHVQHKVKSCAAMLVHVSSPWIP